MKISLELTFILGFVNKSWTISGLPFSTAMCKADLLKV